MIYTSVSFVGSTVLAEELKLLGPRYATGVIVTQVVPALGHSSLVLDYKTALGKYFPGEAPDYVSLEGYVAANVLIAALKRNDRALDTESLVTTLEDLRDLDLGLGTPVTFSRSEHQGVHKVWGTHLTQRAVSAHRPGVAALLLCPFQLPSHSSSPASARWHWLDGGGSGSKPPDQFGT